MSQKQIVIRIEDKIVLAARIKKHRKLLKKRAIAVFFTLKSYDLMIVPVFSRNASLAFSRELIIAVLPVLAFKNIKHA